MVCNIIEYINENLNREITINELREIDSIKIKLDDNLINYLSNEEGVSMKGTPSSFMLRNVGINTLNLDIAI